MSASLAAQQDVDELLQTHVRASCHGVYVRY